MEKAHCLPGQLMATIQILIPQPVDMKFQDSKDEREILKLSEKIKQVPQKRMRISQPSNFSSNIGRSNMCL